MDINEGVLTRMSLGVLPDAALARETLVAYITFILAFS